MTRFHELDALRAFAMLLGVVLHAALFLVTKDWPVVAKEISPDLPYDDIVLAIHGFRMPVFFLLSGFFTALLWQRRGTHALIMHRLKHVGLPLLIGVFTIVPLQSLWWIFTHDGEVDFAGVVWTVLLGCSWSLHHLWFLWVLLLLVGVFVGFISISDKLLDRRFWWGLIPLVLVPQLLMTEQTWGPDTSAQLWVNPLVLAYYACFFHVWGVHVPDRSNSRSALGLRAPAGDTRIFRGSAFRVCRQRVCCTSLFECSADRVRVGGVFRFDGTIQDHCFEGSILGSVRIGYVVLDLSVAPGFDIQRAVDCG